MLSIISSQVFFMIMNFKLIFLLNIENKIKISQTNLGTYLNAHLFRHKFHIFGLLVGRARSRALKNKRKIKRFR